MWVYRFSVVQNVPPTFPSQPQTRPSHPSGASPHGLAYGGQSQRESQPSAVEMQYYAPSLKVCPADGCTNKVHYDYELGPFDYCSPACRDRHLLPRERERLKKDIEEYSRKIADLPPLDNPPTASPMTGASHNGEMYVYLCDKNTRKLSIASVCIYTIL